MAKRNKNQTKAERKRLLEAAEIAIDELHMYNEPSYEETLEDLKSLQDRIDVCMEGLREDIQRRDSDK